MKKFILTILICLGLSVSFNTYDCYFYDNHNIVYASENKKENKTNHKNKKENSNNKNKNKENNITAILSLFLLSSFIYFILEEK